MLGESSERNSVRCEDWYSENKYFSVSYQKSQCLPKYCPSLLSSEQPLSPQKHFSTLRETDEARCLCPICRGSGVFLGGAELAPLYRSHCRHQYDTESQGVPPLAFVLFMKHTWELLACLDFSIKNRFHVQIFKKNHSLRSWTQC